MARESEKRGWEERETTAGRASTGGMLPGISKVRDHFAFGRKVFAVSRATKYKECARGEKRGLRDRWWSSRCDSFASGQRNCDRRVALSVRSKRRFDSAAMAFADHNVQAV